MLSSLIIFCGAWPPLMPVGTGACPARIGLAVNFKFSVSFPLIFQISFKNSPICACGPRRAKFFWRTASLMRSTSYWYRLRSRMAPSLASFKAVSSALTRSIVVRSRFSSFGSSQRRSALSRTNCLWTFVNCSRLFSKKEIFCFCANDPPSSSLSSLLMDFLIRACKS